jgi:hypothetical protein
METWQSFQLTAIPAVAGRSGLRDAYGPSLWIVLAIAGMVLCIAYANIANLQVAQTAVRRTEFAVRIALGARWHQLTAQLFIENLLLSITDAACGAMVGTRLISFLLSMLATRRDPIQLDLAWGWSTMAFMIAVAVGACALMGIAPAVQVARLKLAMAIRSGNRGGGQPSQSPHSQEFLIGLQIAISLALLVTSVSFVRSFRALSTCRDGFSRGWSRLLLYRLLAAAPLGESRGGIFIGTARASATHSRSRTGRYQHARAIERQHLDTSGASARS